MHKIIVDEIRPLRSKPRQGHDEWYRDISPIIEQSAILSGESEGI